MKLFPDLSQLETLVLKGNNVVPICHEILADLETPVSCFLKVKEQFPQNGPFFLLESVEGGEKVGRYSFIGLNPAGVLRINPETSQEREKLEFYSEWGISEKYCDLNENPYECLESVISNFKSPSNLFPHTSSGLVGALAYDSVRFIEPIDLIKVSREFPEMAFVLIGDLIVFDNLTKTIRLITNIYTDNQTSNTDIKELYDEAVKRLEKLKTIFESEKSLKTNRIIPTDELTKQEKVSHWKSSIEKKEFESIVEIAKEHIRAGDIFQIVLSQQLTIETEKKIDPFHLYRLLRSLNPSPYLFFLDFLDFQIIGSSPEVMVHCNSVDSENNRIASLRPIAGTYRRGRSHKEDEELAKSLKNDPKELAEHLMLIDLARNDLGRVAIPGTVEVADLMVVEKYSHVLHLVSEVVCELKNDISPIQLLKATFPAGTLSGAPKVKAMQIISELESVSRGFYGGCVGAIGFDGSINTAMTIRSLFVTPKKIQLQVGAGVVYDSDPEKEYQETLNKGAALMKVIEQSMQLNCN
ncbi:MAG: chorismate-binding protein [Candidatus Caenarcaniphilales bacterium]|nr:chorismate-binding protein [Candidatus Caenarcaniphilales bacterium]